MRTRGTATARAAEVECDEEMDETVAEYSYVVAGGVHSMTVLPVPPTASVPAGAQDPAGVSDVYTRARWRVHARALELGTLLLGLVCSRQDRRLGQARGARMGRTSRGRIFHLG